MGKTMSRDERKNSKYTARANERQRKFDDMFEPTQETKQKPRPKQKWKPHSEIEVD